MGNILEIVLEHAGRHGIGRVAKINLEVGELSDLIPEWMQTYFDFVSKDTIAEKAVIAVEKIPATLRCKSCGNEFTITRDNFQFACPACDSADVELLRGREFKIISIEVEEPGNG
jgi:hydrogenase nickel incorporation protein HypA/HybF